MNDVNDAMVKSMMLSSSTHAFKRSIMISIIRFINMINTYNHLLDSCNFDEKIYIYMYIFYGERTTIALLRNVTYWDQRSYDFSF